MSDTKYTADLEKELPDLEVLKLRKENAELKLKLEQAHEVLKENGIEEVIPKVLSDEEEICIKQISILKQLSDKGLPFAIEDVKNLEILVRTLLAIRGKVPIEDSSKNKKKKESHKVADLLAIVKQDS